MNKNESKSGKKNLDVGKALRNESISDELGLKIQASVFAKHGFAYVGSKKGPEFVDKVYADGRRETGKYVNGEFIPLK